VRPEETSKTHPTADAHASRCRRPGCYTPSWLLGVREGHTGGVRWVGARPGMAHWARPDHQPPSVAARVPGLGEAIRDSADGLQPGPRHDDAGRQQGQCCWLRTLACHCGRLAGSESTVGMGATLVWEMMALNLTAVWRDNEAGALRHRLCPAKDKDAVRAGRVTSFRLEYCRCAKSWMRKLLCRPQETTNKSHTSLRIFTPLGCTEMLLA